REFVTLTALELLVLLRSKLSSCLYVKPAFCVKSSIFGVSVKKVPKTLLANNLGIASSYMLAFFVLGMPKHNRHMIPQRRMVAVRLLRIVFSALATTKHASALGKHAKRHNEMLTTPQHFCARCADHVSEQFFHGIPDYMYSSGKSFID